MAAIVDWDRDGTPDIAVPDASRRALRIISLAGGTLGELDRIALEQPIATAVVAAIVGSDPVLVFALINGALILVHQ